MELHYQKGQLSREEVYLNRHTLELGSQTVRDEERGSC